jgi:hypothetical protein
MTELQKNLAACIVFLGFTGGILWLRMFSPWAWH